MKAYILNIIYIMSFACGVIIFFNRCTDDSATANQTLIDAEGNEYPYGKMCDGKFWMLKNLASKKFRNGDSIAYVYQEDWKDIPIDSAAYCVFADSFVLVSEYGFLYNWYAVSDSRGLAPVGWHVATADEWKQLVECNGGEPVAGNRLKEAGTAHWKSGTGNNKSGFNALPGSRRLDVPNPDLGLVAVFWTALPNEECHGGLTSYYGTHDSGPNAYSNCGNNRFGFSVRCVKDE